MPQPRQLFKPIALKTQRDWPGVSGRKNNIITVIIHTINSKFCKKKFQYFFNNLFNIV
jgi:hypothetical protein